MAILFYTSQTKDTLAGVGYPVLHFSDKGYLSQFLAILFYTSQTYDTLAGVGYPVLHFSDI
jgi:hypothetical protein